MIYFAYGSNMCLGRLQERVSSAQFIEIAKIEGYCVEFHKRSDHSIFGSSGKATLLKNYDSEVYGALYSFDDIDIRGLRYAEGCPTHYREENINVLTLSGTKSAMTYLS